MRAGSIPVEDSVAHQGRGQLARRHRFSNVFQLLARREITPRTRDSSKRLQRDASKCNPRLSGLRCEASTDSRRSLLSWVEAESLLHLSAKYCPLLPPPRSTIAAAFSPDGKILASTHGDHTVKIIDYQSGTCLKVLSGHRRTPWVVRFHPNHSDILASGSLDHEVRLWDANTAECIGSLDFYRPIASIAFHAQGDLLAVASGHKLYIWPYNKRGEGSSPTIVLKTRRSLRAVHFHPHAAPLLLTAEVNEIDTSGSSMTLATAPGNVHYPSPTVFLADGQSSSHQSFTDDISVTPLPSLIWPSLSREVRRSSVQNVDGDIGSSIAQQRVDTSGSLRLLTYSTPSGQYELLISPIEPSSSSTAHEETSSSFLGAREDEISESASHTVEAMAMQSEERNNQPFQLSELDPPFLSGWVTGEAPAGRHGTQPLNGPANESSPALSGTQTAIPPNNQVPENRTSLSRAGARFGSQHHTSHSRVVPVTGSGETFSYSNIAQSEGDPQPVITRIQSELAASFATVAAPELPCTVKLRVWVHDIKDPCAPLDPEKCRLTIPHAVLCSEMGAHFSPCGRFLAACVACVLPHSEAETGLQGQVNHDATGASTSPTRHPISAHHVVYELRIYSLEKATFGMVLASRAIRAAHCLTSIQFSPTSEHLLLAYGRRHSSLLKSVIVDGESTVPIYTILEVYRVSDMELVRVLPSAEDEVNVACFHPSAGGGLIYGTKEGKLRILQYDCSRAMNFLASGFFDGNMFEVPTFALEC